MHNEFCIQRLAFEREQRFLFRDITASITAGEILQIQGANGSGKSTLLRILAGLLTPESGEVTWQGKSIFHEHTDYQQNMHYLGHQNGLKKYLTVQENLKLYSALTASKLNLDDLKNILQKMQLENLAHTQTRTLSAGQLRRLSLARLLLQPRALWILDEPMTALDSDGQTLLHELLNEHLKNNGYAILATHQNLCLQRPLKIIRLGNNNA